MGQHFLQVMVGEHIEGNQRFGAGDIVLAGELLGDQVRQVFVGRVLLVRLPD